MSDNLRTYTKAVYGFDHVVRLVPDDAWDDASPCEGWTARDVLGHVVAVQRYLLSLVEGTAPTMDPFTDPGQHAGDDPAATWAETRDALLEALDQAGVLQRVVQSFWGEMPIDSTLSNNLADTTVHSWDLARATGVDERLDQGVAERALAQITPAVEHMRAGGMLGPAADAVDDSASARLLALSGREV
ncbi:MAG: TIGR03086 family metal-binding protein [Acidimicrobiales bacterium]